METSQVATVTLITGERMDRAEFMRRWEEIPEIKKAELIEGVVFVASPVGSEHGRREIRIGWWLTQYADATPGCECGTNVTWYMEKSAPQPDAFLRVRPDCGGQSGDERLYHTGAPELAVEVCETSTEVDFGPKLRLYRRAGVREYITIEIFPRRIVWRTLEQSSYVTLPPDPDGVIRSRVFPGLWLDVAGFWEDNAVKLMATLERGLATPEHTAFKERLQRK